MSHIPIAELKPELPDLDSKHFTATVTLIWPWSSSARQFALLLAEPEFRLRRKNGQVRARFSGSSARALASTGVGIGDEVVMSLRGASFVREGTVSTPGKSIDYELEYTQTVSVRIIRSGTELASLELADVAPTPIVRSPVRQTAYKPVLAALEEPKIWSSPAFLKRTRLSEGPVFEAGYDPFTDDTEDRHAKKRRRKSYKDWNAWTYSARTPSPEMDDATEDYDRADAPPIRPMHLPSTPVSPSKSQPPSVAGLPLLKSDGAASKDTIHENRDKDVEEIGMDDEDQEADRPVKNLTSNVVVRDADYYDLYAGPNELLSSNTQYKYEGDTVSNTEEEDEVDTVPNTSQRKVAAFAESVISTRGIGLREYSEMSIVEVDSEEGGIETESTSDAAEVAGSEYEVSEEERDSSSDVIKLIPEDDGEEAEEPTSSVKDTRVAVVEVKAPSGFVEADMEQTQRARERSETHGDLDDDDGEELPTVMGPPNLPLLQTDFQPPRATGLLTSIVVEPLSPNLKPLDSSTLPMPSPFPGEHDGTTSSYLEHTGSSQLYEPVQAQEPQQSKKEIDYAVESSFYSSLGSSRAPVFHESAFTDVRFAFGMDGAAFSRVEEPVTSHHVEVDVDGQVYDATVEEDVRLLHDQEVFTEAFDLPTVDDKFASGPFPGMPDLTNEPLAAQERGEARVIELSSSSAEEVPDNQDRIASVRGSSDNSYWNNATDIQSHESSVEQQQSIDDQNRVQLDRKSADDGDGEQNDEDTSGEPFSEEKENVEVRLADPPEILGHAVEGENDMDVFGPETHIHRPTSVDNHSTPEEQAATPIIGTQMSTAGTEIIDLGSSSGAESGEEEPTAEMQGSAAQVNDLVGEDMLDDIPYDADRTDSSRSPVQVEGHSAEHLGEAAIHAVLREPNRVDATFSDDEQPVIDNDLQPVTGEDSYNILPDAPDAPDQADVRLDTSMQGYLDIKVESIEEDATSDWLQMQSAPPQEDEEEPGNGKDADLLIAIPAEGNKVGELQFKTVPPTAPARNTRSKTKAPMSPVKDEQPTSQQTTRPRKGKTSISSIARVTLSPSATLPTKDTTPVSPYSLRSQSKLLSPTKSTTFGTQIDGPRKRPAKPTNIEVEPKDDVPAVGDSFQSADLEFPHLSFDKLDDLDASQGKYSNVGYVKDSEEGSLHSENSISTMQYSNDWNPGGQSYTNFSDPVDSDTQIRDGSTPLKPRSIGRGSSPAIPSHLSVETQSKTGPQVLTPTKKTRSQPAHSFPTQSAQSTSSKMRVSMTPTEIASSSPRRSRRLRKDAYDLSIDEDELRGTVTPKQAESIALLTYLALSSESEDDQVRSSPPPMTQLNEKDPAGNAKVVIASSPPAEPSETGFVYQQSLINSAMPMTPEATQQTYASQPSFPAARQEQSMPMTPQLTQSPFANLRSSKVATEEEVSFTSLSKPKISPINRSTPRRNISTTEASRFRSASPSSKSENMSGVEASTTLVAPQSEMELPSIGLSTPLAYYTPLKDLNFFLNRSSQFHSSSNPDVLALVTSSTTAPKKAEKGPKHWNTTLHITDLSSYPATTTAQVFRPYAQALPVAQKGDVVLLRSFGVKSLNRHPTLVSGDESAWCVWRYSAMLWGKKRGAFGEVKSREEVKGPAVERGEGEWREVEKLREWWERTIEAELEDKAESGAKTRSRDHK